VVVFGFVFTGFVFVVWFVFLWGFAGLFGFGSDCAVDNSLVNMGECWRSVVSVVDACCVTSLVTSLVVWFSFVWLFLASGLSQLGLVFGLLFGFGWRFALR
jgi:hypothetical protein